MLYFIIFLFQFRLISLSKDQMSPSSTVLRSPIPLDDFLYCFFCAEENSVILSLSLSLAVSMCSNVVDFNNRWILLFSKKNNSVCFVQQKKENILLAFSEVDNNSLLFTSELVHFNVHNQNGEKKVRQRDREKQRQTSRQGTHCCNELKVKVTHGLVLGN